MNILIWNNYCQSNLQVSIFVKYLNPQIMYGIVNADQYKEENNIFTGENEYVMSHDLASVIPYAALRMRNITCLSNEECAAAIANHLQSSNKFMQDDSVAKRFRMETLRAMPQCLSVKRYVKSQLLANVNQKTRKKPISYWKLLRYNISLKCRKVVLMLPRLLFFDYA